MRKLFTMLLVGTMTASMSLSSLAATRIDFANSSETVTEETSDTDIQNSESEVNTSNQDSDDNENMGTTPTSQSHSKDHPIYTTEDGSYSDLGASYQVNTEDSGLDLTAESAIVMDANSGKILYGKEPTTKRYPASITKVMTSLVTIENSKMNDIVTYSDDAVNGIDADSSVAGINVGAKLSVRDSLYALMLVSANESGVALADKIAGSTDAFAKLMTQRARELGCRNTHFTNPHGLPDENHYTTARDMGLIVREAISYPEFRKIAGTLSYTLKKSDTLNKDIELFNHAKIMNPKTEYYYKNVEGAKTGFTSAALNTLVSYAKDDNTELIAIILKDHGANYSYYDSKKLYEWAFDNIKTLTPLSNFNMNTALKNTKTSKGKALSQKKISTIQGLQYTYNKDYTVLVPKDLKLSDQDFSTSFTLKEDKDNGILGYINIKKGSSLIGKTPVTYNTSGKSGKAYLSGSDSTDLKTAPEDPKTFTPMKLLQYLIRFAIAMIIIFVIMQLIRRREAEKRRKARIHKRKMSHSIDQNPRSSSRQNTRSVHNSRSGYGHNPRNSNRNSSSTRGKNHESSKRRKNSNSTRNRRGR